MLLDIGKYNNVQYLLYLRFTSTTMFGTCRTCLSQVQQCSVLVVLAFHNYNNVRYLLYLPFTITTMFSACCTCVSQSQQCSVLVVLAFHNHDNVRYLLYLRFTIIGTTMFGTCCTCVSRLIWLKMVLWEVCSAKRRGNVFDVSNTDFVKHTILIGSRPKRRFSQCFSPRESWAPLKLCQWWFCNFCFFGWFGLKMVL